MRQFLLRHLPLTMLAAALGLSVLWSILAPIKGGSHQLLLAFPPGVTVSGMAVPDEIRLTRGVQDVLLLRNSDRVPIVFGPLKLAPGRDVRLPFGEEGVFEYVCPPVLGKVVRVRVVAAPGPGWGRLVWRLGSLRQWVRYLPLRSPAD
ncbi:hypothetical protein RCH14_003779 [Massilia sp. MP_M2]|uniref:cupredoxin domain-containing protein n=1 Tax=Massilia sp. MP_M2 TaxID=3071713 RepID=UPI00319D92C8